MYSLIVAIIVSSLFCLLWTPQVWNSVGTVIVCILLYGVINLFFMIFWGLTKRICPDFSVIEGALLFFLFMLIQPIHGDITNILRIWINMPYSDYYSIVYWGLLCFLYLMLRVRLRKNKRNILCIRKIEARIMSKTGSLYIAILMILLFLMLLVKDAFR